MSRSSNYMIYICGPGKGLCMYVFLFFWPLLFTISYATKKEREGGREGERWGKGERSKSRGGCNTRTKLSTVGLLATTFHELFRVRA